MMKLNLEMVPQGSLNHISIKPTLHDSIVTAQLQEPTLHDSIIKEKLSQEEAKYKCFRVDHRGVLWFESLLVVPKNHQLRKQILDEAHLSKFSIHPGSTKMYQSSRIIQ